MPLGWSNSAETLKQRITRRDEFGVGGTPGSWRELLPVADTEPDRGLGKRFARERRSELRSQPKAAPSAVIFQIICRASASRSEKYLAQRSIVRRFPRRELTTKTLHWKNLSARNRITKSSPRASAFRSSAARRPMSVSERVLITGNVRSARHVGCQLLLVIGRLRSATPTGFLAVRPNRL